MYDRRVLPRNQSDRFYVILFFVNVTRIRENVLNEINVCFENKYILLKISVRRISLGGNKIKNTFWS